ncbi:hypothetical protein F5879DRAFT_946800 [Lentinula edodes]|nr:hypothetical protein F5879DRAFT_946800 [Lentinula edodes]
MFSFLDQDPSYLSLLATLLIIRFSNQHTTCNALSLRTLFKAELLCTSPPVALHTLYVSSDGSCKHGRQLPRLPTSPNAPRSCLQALFWLMPRNDAV